MNQYKNKLSTALAGTFGLVILIALIAIGFAVFAYLLIFGIIIGAAVVTIGYIRSLILRRRQKVEAAHRPKETSGRTIEYSEIED